MANKTSKKSAKVAKNAATRRVDAKAAKPRKKAPKSQSRKVAKPPARTAGKRRASPPPVRMPMRFFAMTIP